MMPILAGHARGHSRTHALEHPLGVAPCRSTKGAGSGPDDDRSAAAGTAWLYWPGWRAPLALAAVLIPSGHQSSHTDAALALLLVVGGRRSSRRLPAAGPVPDGPGPGNAVHPGTKAHSRRIRRPGGRRAGQQPAGSPPAVNATCSWRVTRKHRLAPAAPHRTNPRTATAPVPGRRPGPLPGCLASLSGAVWYRPSQAAFGHPLSGGRYQRHDGRPEPGPPAQVRPPRPGVRADGTIRLPVADGG